MDELTRGVVLALVGVITGGVLVVIGQSVGDRRLEQRLKLAVLAEIRQNATVLDTIYAMAPNLEPLPRLHAEAKPSALQSDNDIRDPARFRS